jgi:hypothetical protein
LFFITCDGMTRETTFAVARSAASTVRRAAPLARRRASTRERKVGGVTGWPLYERAVAVGR